MPTPSDDTVVAPTEIPIDDDVRRCPPEERREERREHHTLREERLPTPEEPASDEPSRNDSPHRSVDANERDVALEGEAQLGASDTLHPPSRHGKSAHVDSDIVLIPEPPSPTVGSPDAPSDSDARLAQSMSTAAISPETADTPSPLYLHYPELERDRMVGPNSTTSFLRPGSKFRGTQQSDRQVYDVQVELKDVNMEESRLCGYLRIQGLTDDHPTLTTFFEGEIIGPHYLFRTSHPSWGSTEKVDLQHWARFPAWRPLAKSAAKNPHFTLKNPWEKEHLFMRWKEYFLVPDHRVKQISGASFEGFYYICFDQRMGGVSGIYFHSKSEKYQQLELRWVDDGGRVPAVEFR